MPGHVVIAHTLRVSAGSCLCLWTGHRLEP